MERVVLLVLLVHGTAGTGTDPAPACSSVCLPGQCVGGGEHSYHCTACVTDRKLILTEPQDITFSTTPYGRCIVCADNCAPGACVGERSDQCTACPSHRQMANNSGGVFGTCIQCPQTCSKGKCTGERGDQCLACSGDKVLVDLIAVKLVTANSTKRTGACTECSNVCVPGKCVGPRADHCTQCQTGRALVKPTPTQPHGSCISCASNCLPGRCAGPHPWQCSMCNEAKVLVKGEGALADKAFGTCVACSSTCAPLKCVGSESNQCTTCAPGRTLLQLPGKSHGECPSDSVLSKKLLVKRIEEQRKELERIRESQGDRRELGESQGDKELGEGEDVQAVQTHQHPQDETSKLLEQSRLLLRDDLDVHELGAMVEREVAAYK